jgi:hypothetical protein
MRHDRDGFEADRRLQPGSSSKSTLQRKSPTSTSYNSSPPSSSEPIHEEAVIQIAISSVSSTSTTDKSVPAAPAANAANASQRPVRSTTSTAPSGISSERFVSRPRDGSDPDYDRHYGKYAPRSAMVPAGMAWPVMPATGGYGMPVAGIPMGAPYEAMSPMYLPRAITFSLIRNMFHVYFMFSHSLFPAMIFSTGMIFGTLALPSATAAQEATLEWDRLLMRFPRILRHTVTSPHRDQIKRICSKALMDMLGASLVLA